MKTKKRRLRLYLSSLILYLLSFIIMISPILLKTNNSRVVLSMLFIGVLLIFVNITILITMTFFNNKEKFNEDSLLICLCCLLILGPVIYVTFILTTIPELQKYSKIFATFSAGIIIVISLYFWIIYLFRCIKSISEIKKDKFLFSFKMIKIMLTAILVCFSATMVIFFLPNKQIFLKLVYQVTNVFINAMYPFIDMYTCVRLEIDDFDKQKKIK